MENKDDTVYYEDYKDSHESTRILSKQLFQDKPKNQNLTSLTVNSVKETSMILENSSFDLDEKSIPLDMQFNSGHIISISIYSVLFVISAFGNITVLVAILRRKRRREFLSRIDLILMHLAVADLMTTFLMMPLEIGWAATVEWKAGDWMCRMMAFFRIFGLYLSGFVLVCLATDRYLAVRNPMQGLASTKRAKLMLISAWILSCLCSLPQILIFHVESHPTYTWFTQCITYNVFPNSEYELAYNIFVMTMMYTLPLILLVGLHTSIVSKLWKMGHSTRDIFGSPDGLRRSGADYIERAKVKSIQMTFIITATYWVCWTPYYVMCVWYWFDPQTAKSVDLRVQKVLFLFACTNCTVNPIVYGLFDINSIFGEKTRQVFKRRNIHNKRTFCLSLYRCFR